MSYAYRPSQEPGPLLLPPRTRRRRWWERIPPLARVANVHETIRARLAEACALENPPPERFGFRFDTAVRLFMVTTFFHRRYFRVVPHGIESLPDGPVMLVSNHGSHVLAWDGAMILTSCLLDADPPRLAHGMAEHKLMELPVLGAAARRIGAVDGRREACQDLLRAGGVVLTFPEGTKALARPFRDRYRVLNFGHGFMHVALATGAPIVPVAVIGAEEIHPVLARLDLPGRLVGLPTLPITPTFPWLGAAGLVPLPTKWLLFAGEPLDVAARTAPSDAADPVAVARLRDQVRERLQALILEGLRRRRGIFA